MSDTPYLREPRDILMRKFVPELQHILNETDKKTMEHYAKTLLGTDKPGTCLRSRFEKSPEEDPDAYIADKKREYFDMNYRYARIFDLCRVIGVKHIFDIGCQGVNQAFLLGDFCAMSYTGMDMSFSLNDWRPRDAEDRNYHLPITGEAPPPLAEGRIRFVKGRYPETALDVPPESIAVGCYSMTMTAPENIPAMAEALHRDFDRMLFNVSWSRKETMEAWKTAAESWTGFTIRPIGQAGFIYATRHPEDIERLSAVYPVDEHGRILTGIDDGMLYLCGHPLYAMRTYADWFRDGED